MTKTTDWRIACSELLQIDDEQPSDYADWMRRWKAAIFRARAALAESVAAPAEPTDEAAVEAAAELIYMEAMEWAARQSIPSGHINIPAWQQGGNSDAQEVARRTARAALAAKPLVEGPTDEEVEAWADDQGFIRGHGDHPCGFWIDDGDVGALVRAALARWGGAGLAPVEGEVAEGLTDEELERRFQVWWYDEGSGMPPGADEDPEAHVHRISQIAWHNGAYVARYGHQPAPPAGELLKEAAWLRNECSAENADGNWISMSIDQALDLASLLERQAAPAPAGEVGELVKFLRGCSDARMDEGYESLGFKYSRTADLLGELERVAYAASDFICGTRFPEFAEEHGGIDRLMANLCRLVAQFEHGPRPVPGVDVPGPDGDWGGLEELCNAEGVDPRIGVPLLQRAQEAWKNALAEGIGPRSDMVEWACLLRPSAPEPDREAADLAATLLQISDGASACGDEVTSWTTARAAKLLQRLDLYEKELSAVIPSDFKDWWENSKDEWPSVAARVIESLRRREEWALEQLERQAAPVPVAVSERLPGLEDCLDEGWAWFFSPRVGWRQAVLPVSAAYTHWLPAHALPLPGNTER